MVFPKHIKFTETEREILESTMHAKRPSEIAAERGRSVLTVKRHLTNIFDKTGFDGTVELMRYFHQLQVDVLKTEIELLINNSGAHSVNQVAELKAAKRALRRIAAQLRRLSEEIRATETRVRLGKRLRNAPSVAA